MKLEIRPKPKQSKQAFKLIKKPGRAGSFALVVLMNGVGYHYSFTRLKFKTVADLLLDIIAKCRIDLQTELALYCDEALMLDVGVITRRSSLELRPVSLKFEQFRQLAISFTKQTTAHTDNDHFEFKNGDQALPPLTTFGKRHGRRRHVRDDHSFYFM